MILGLFSLGCEAYRPIDDAAQVDTGQDFSCIRTVGGAVQCWGDNTYGQLGDGTVQAHPVAETVMGLGSGVAQVVTGTSHACARLSTGAVRCWGKNLDGQLGNNGTTSRSEPVSVWALTNVTSLAAGGRHSCALTAAGAVYCWGDNTFGQLGMSASTTELHVPGAVPGLSVGVAAITAGEDHTCARMSSGAMQCWGRNNAGQIGDGSSGTHRFGPVAVSGLSSGVLAISAGGYHTCARVTGNALRCWGMNDKGQLGDGSREARNTPTLVSGFSSGGLVVSAGAKHTCAIDANGAVQCWGLGMYGQLGQGGTSDSLLAGPVEGITSGALSVAAGDSHTCARLSGGAVRCWGNNDVGALGDGHTELVMQPTAVVGVSSGVSSLSSGGLNTCARIQTGALRCWGSNRVGTLGVGNLDQYLNPVTVMGVGAGLVSAGYWHVCAVLVNGTARCWGGNGDGELGTGDFSGRTLPTDVVGVSSFVGIDVGEAHTCAVTQVGELWCWGNNMFGQLGDGSTTDRSIPVRVYGISGEVRAVSGGNEHTCALNDSGTAYCWGNNNRGQLGNGSLQGRLSPSAVVGLGSGLVEITSGGFHSCALTADGSVFCWGDNGSGQLGDGSFVDRPNPIAVSGLGGVAIAVSAGELHTCAVLSGGVVRCWGGNEKAQLGDGTTQSRSQPVTVQDMPIVAYRVSAGLEHTCARSSTGTPVCWGGNRDGQIGNGTAATRSYPVISLRSDQLFRDGFE